jgi:hypothetical protein
VDNSGIISEVQSPNGPGRSTGPDHAAAPRPARRSLRPTPTRRRYSTPPTSAPARSRSTTPTSTPSS